MCGNLPDIVVFVCSIYVGSLVIRFTINKNIVSAYAPQVGCTDEEKEEFWEELEELIRSFSEKDKIVIGAHLNRHIGRGNTGRKMAWWFWTWAKIQEGDNILECYASI